MFIQPLLRMLIKRLRVEANWFGPYQIVQRVLLGTYRLQDPNGRELAALVHGNRLIKPNISTADELRDLWAQYLHIYLAILFAFDNINLSSSYSTIHTYFVLLC